jgi:Peptidase family M41
MIHSVITPGRMSGWKRKTATVRTHLCLAGLSKDELATGDYLTPSKYHRVSARIPRGFCWSVREYSEATAAKIDQEVQRLRDERHKTVYELLTGAREKLDLLVDTLLKEETVDQAMLREILKARPTNANGDRR